MKIFIVLFYIFGLFAHGNTPKYSEYTINTVWKNNNEILLHKRIVEVRYGVDDTFAWKNEKILIYDLLQRRTRDFLNGRYSTKSKFVISPDGNRIFQYCYSDKMMYLFDNNWRKLSILPQKNLIINPRDDNCRIYDKYLFRNEYAQNKPALAVTDLITGETKMIPVKDSLLPADIPMFDMEYKFPVFRSQKNSIFTFDFSTFRINEFFSLPDKTGSFFINRNGSRIFFEQEEKKGKNRITIWDVKSGTKSSVRIPQNFFLCQASEHFFMLYPTPNEQDQGKDNISVILCNHQGKILKTYQFKRRNNSQFFPGISPDEKNIVFRNFSGEIIIRKIPEKYLAEAVDTVLRK